MATLRDKEIRRRERLARKNSAKKHRKRRSAVEAVEAKKILDARQAEEANFRRYSLAYRNPEVPRLIGLLIPVRAVGTPAADEVSPERPAKRGYVLVDTSRSRTALSETVAATLGRTDEDIFRVDYHLRFPKKEGKPDNLRFRRRSLVVPDEDLLPAAAAELSDELRAERDRIIAVLGRDFLADLRLQYDGPRRRLEVRVPRGGSANKTAAAAKSS